LFGFGSWGGGNPPQGPHQVAEVYHLPLLLVVLPKVLLPEGALVADGFRPRALLQGGFWWRMVSTC